MEQKKIKRKKVAQWFVMWGGGGGGGGDTHSGSDYLTVWIRFDQIFKIHIGVDL